MELLYIKYFKVEINQLFYIAIPLWEGYFTMVKIMEKGVLFMKNFLKFFGIVTLVVTIGFSVVGCDDGAGYEMLDGIWERGDIVLNFSGGNATFKEIKSRSGWISTNVKIGDQKFRNIDKVGDLKWSCQELVYNSSTYVTSWENCTITLSTNGQTIQTVASWSSSTYSKQ